jgi:hypothetical protein
MEPDPNAHADLDAPEVKEEFLHPCCQKELKADRIRTRVMTKLRDADVTRIAMERRQGAVGVLKTGEHRHEVRCCLSFAWSA